MNIAVCISGQNRKDKINYNFLDTFKNYNNIDVFLHMWSDEINRDVLEKFKPKKYLFESQLDFRNNAYIFVRPLLKFFGLKDNIKYFNTDFIDWEWKLTDKKDVSKRILFGKNLKPPVPAVNLQKEICENILSYGNTAHSMFYSLYYCNEMKNIYERQNKIKYDLVIRIRPDIIVQPEIDISKLTDDCIYTSEWSRYINDILAISNKKNMDAYCSTYLHLKNILLDVYNNDEINYLCAESILYQSLKNQNICIKHIEKCICKVLK